MLLPPETLPETALDKPTVLAAALPTVVPKFQRSEGSAQLAFSRYGADYLIEFECREIDSPEGCITEAQAKEFAESLFVAQSR